MSLVLMEGWDHYPRSDAYKKGWAESTTTWSMQTGRLGGQCMRLDASGGPVDTITKNLPSSYSTLFAGGAFLFQTPTATNRFYSLDTTGGTICVQLGIAGGNFALKNSGGTLLAQGTTVVAALTWYYVEFKVFFSATVGTIELRVNGVTEATASALNTGANNAGRVALLGGTGTPYVQFDDLYICDNSGAGPTNDFLTDCRVETLMPNANGTTSNLVGSDGNSTDNYLLVDDPATSDTDTTYVQSATVGDKDTYNYPPVTPSSGPVYAVQPTPDIRKTDAGTRKFRTVARLSVTEEDSAEKPLSVSYQYYTDIRETKPGGGAWTITDINSAEFGIKVST